MKSFLVKYRRAFMSLALVLVVGMFALAMSGCASPTWLNDAGSIIGTIGTSIATIGAFIAALTGNAALAEGLAVIGTWITKIFRKNHSCP